MATVRSKIWEVYRDEITKLGESTYELLKSTYELLLWDHVMYFGELEDWNKYLVSKREMIDNVMFDHMLLLLEARASLIGVIAMSTSPFKKGRVDPSELSSGGGRFLRIKDGEAAVFAPLLGLDEMIRANMHEHWDVNPAVFHPCIGTNCPGCAVGNEARFRGYLPVYTKDGETVIYPFTITVYRQLLELEEEVEGGTLRGYVVKVKRTGTGFNTKYTVLGTGKNLDVSELEVPEFVSSLGPTTEEDITKALREGGVTVMGHGEPDGPYDEPSTEDDPWGDL